MNVFITGSTGFLGGEILMLLSKREEITKIYCLLRADNEAVADARLEKVFKLHDDFFDRNKVIPVIGNLSDDGMDQQLIANEQLKDVNVIIHSAANTSFAKIYDDVVQKVNLNGLQQILNWSKTLDHLETFTYVGTATIIGKGVTDRLIFEDESPSADSIHFVKYTYTKMMGELMIREALPVDKILIVRPSIILGDSRARIPRSNVILWTLAAVNVLRLIPVRPAPKLDIISVDYAAYAIDALLFAKRNHTVYHVSAGEHSCTTNLKLTEAIAPHFSDRPDFKFISHKLLNQIKLWAKNKLPADAELHQHTEYLDYWHEVFEEKSQLRILFGGMDPYIEFINLGQVFDNKRLIEDTGIHYPEAVHEYIQRCIDHLGNIDIMEGALDP